MKRFSPEGTLLIILLVTLITGLFGIYIEKNYSPLMSLILFATYSALYYIFAGYYVSNEKENVNENV
jgi:hypothetical protein